MTLITRPILGIAAGVPLVGGLRSSPGGAGTIDQANFNLPDLQ